MYMISWRYRRVLHEASSDIMIETRSWGTTLSYTVHVRSAQI